MAKQRQLIEHSDFERMRVFHQPISVFLNGELMGSNILIQSHDNEIVTDSNDEKYSKETCQFLRTR
ncbi:hypothetical protein [Paenibacillus sp. Soil787]|uniref:hypothetical protein n=1 Tax=Paenibacillus sp. Soil787 TaxID=1736411 RepID=UPI000702C31B|nr:hypothetical protein [Paenibacillus sp. Soil787]KRF18636.1 hypothetical protein ASG93_11400 [Paenibacillus sp. Soil787]